MKTRVIYELNCDWEPYWRSRYRPSHDGKDLGGIHPPEILIRMAEGIYEIWRN